MMPICFSELAFLGITVFGERTQCNQERQELYTMKYINIEEISPAE